LGLDHPHDIGEACVVARIKHTTLIRKKVLELATAARCNDNAGIPRNAADGNGVARIASPASVCESKSFA